MALETWADRIAWWIGGCMTETVICRDLTVEEEHAPLPDEEECDPSQTDDCDLTLCDLQAPVYYSVRSVEIKVRIISS